MKVAIADINTNGTYKDSMGNKVKVYTNNRPKAPQHEGYKAVSTVYGIRSNLDGTTTNIFNPDYSMNAPESKCY